MAVVLVIEDDDNARHMLQCLLGLHSLTVRLARNGHEGLVAARDTPAPCAILLDLMMPVMDGWEFRRRQRADALIANIPVIVTSAAPPETYRRLGVVAVVPKPCDIDAVIAALRQHAR
jgi:CheY-like chemotaxis protein